MQGRAIESTYNQVPAKLRNEFTVHSSVGSTQLASENPFSHDKHEVFKKYSIYTSILTFD